MAINPLELAKMRERLQIFEQEHPKLQAFVKEVGEHAVMEGTIAEIKVTTPQGKEYITNLRLTAEDMETLRLIRELKK